MRALTAVLCALALLASSAASPPVPQAAATPGDRGPHAKPSDDRVRPFLVRHCLECHGAEKPKGDLRLDRLAPDFADGASREQWLTVLKRLQAGEMPPKSKPRPPQHDVQALADWITRSAEAAEASRRTAHGRVVLRRLNRVEYENTVRDLLGVEVHLKEQLPPDGAADGFDNVASALHISSFLMERYLEAADIALNQAIANRPRPPSIKKRYNFRTPDIGPSSGERLLPLDRQADA
jgi:cytochrome c553